MRDVARLNGFTEKRKKNVFKLLLKIKIRVNAVLTIIIRSWVANMWHSLLSIFWLSDHAHKNWGRGSGEIKEYIIRNILPRSLVFNCFMYRHSTRILEVSYCGLILFFARLHCKNSRALCLHGFAGLHEGLVAFESAGTFLWTTCIRRITKRNCS